MKDEHSPLPWSLRIKPDAMASFGYPDICSVVDADGHVVCNDESYYPVEVKPADSAFIVRAVNCHADLVTVCNALVSGVYTINGCKELARQALDKVEGR